MEAREHLVLFDETKPVSLSVTVRRSPPPLQARGQLLLRMEFTCFPLLPFFKGIELRVLGS